MVCVPQRPPITTIRDIAEREYHASLRAIRELLSFVKSMTALCSPSPSATSVQLRMRHDLFSFQFWTLQRSFFEFRSIHYTSVVATVVASTFSRSIRPSDVGLIVYSERRRLF